ncbi:MAG: hypothetical protein JHD16_15215 [Solirubrobacteraceae bacterium]|nr:hypothetical protein [Solirubrobacteraceae bacterium]
MSKAILLPAAGLLLLFVAVTAIASAAGAINLGTAATFGQVAFGIGLVAFLLRAPRP